MRAVPLVVAVLVLIPCAAWPQGTPLAPEFRVNTYTTGNQAQTAIAADSGGNFVVVWDSPSPYGPRATFGQRYAGSGAPLGSEFRVNTAEMSFTTPSVAADAAGNFVVIWHASVLAPLGVKGQRFANSGAPLGNEFSVGSAAYSFNPAVAS